MAYDYSVEVDIDGKWEPITSVSSDWFDKKDVSFYVSGKVKETISDYLNTPIRLYRMHYTKDDIILGHEVKQFNVWTFSGNKVACLNPNKNYKDFMKKPEDWNN